MQQLQDLQQLQVRLIVDEMINRCLRIIEEKRLVDLKMDDPRTPPPKWQSDETTTHCKGCSEAFNFFKRRVRNNVVLVKRKKLKIPFAPLKPPI